MSTAAGKGDRNRSACRAYWNAPYWNQSRTMKTAHMDSLAAADYGGLSRRYLRTLLGRSWTACAVWTIVAVHALLAGAALAQQGNVWAALAIAASIIAIRGAVRSGRSALAATTEMDRRDR